MKAGLLRSDWFAGLLISILIIFMGNWLGAFDNLERSAYDIGVRSTTKAPSKKIAVISIDDVSIANIGRWPWPRDIHAEMHHILKKGGAKVIGQTTFFIDPQLDPGLKHIHDMIEFYGRSSLADLSNLPPLSKEYKNLPTDIEKLAEKLVSAEQKLNTDNILAQSLEETENVILAMHFAIGEPQGKPDFTLPKYIQRNALTNIKDNPITNPFGYKPCLL